jgi:3-keto-disaccharide hydrolase
MKILLIIILLTLPFARNQKESGEWQELFNGKDLAGWDTYLGPKFDSLGHQLKEMPVGLNPDPDHVFTVISRGEENMIRISGEHFGAIATLDSYENYHFQMMFKWGSLTWIPKKNKKKDSGLLYHSVGPWGADFGYWMRSQEFQIEETNCGDYWGVAGGIADIRARKMNDSMYVYDPKGDLYRFQSETKVGRRCIKTGDAEKPSGEWNQLDLYTHGDTSVHVINGELMMILYHSAQINGGQVIPLVRGRIQIQSEGAEIFLKNIRISPINQIPANFLR